MNLSLRLKQIIIQLFGIFTAVLPFIFFWGNDELFEFNKMLFVYGFTVLVTGLHLSRMIIEKKLLYRHYWLNYPILIFLCSQLLSTVFSLHPYTSFFGYYTRVNGGLLSIICYTLLYLVFIANGEKKHWRQITPYLFISSILIGFYAIGEHYGHSFSCLLISGNFNVKCWVQLVDQRVFATFGQPNWLAAYNVTLIGLGINLIFTASKKSRPNWLKEIEIIAGGIYAAALIGVFKIKKINEVFMKISIANPDAKQLKAAILLLGFIIFAAIAVLLLAYVYRWRVFIFAAGIYTNFIALIFTQSRSGMIAFFASLLFTGCLLIFYWWRQKCLQKQLLTFSLVLLGFLFAALILGTVYTPSLNQLIPKKVLAQSVATTSSSPIPPEVPTHLRHINFKITDSGEIRKIVWRGAWAIYLAHPFLGTGLETFAYSYYAFRPQDHNWVSEWDFLYNKAHNELLNYAANSGTLGLLSYLSIFICLVVGSFKLLRKKALSPYRAYLIIGVNAGLLALSITNFFGFSTVVAQVLLYLYLGIAAIILSPPQKATTIKDNWQNKWQSVSLSLVGIVMFCCYHQLIVIWLADHYYASCKTTIAKPGRLNQALTDCTRAVKLRPHEALYQIELGDYYAQYAAQLALKTPQHEAVTQLVNLSLQYANAGFALNHSNLNFYKTRFRTFASLGTIDPKFIAEAQRTLEAAIKLSPTDPKLTYYYATLLDAQGETTQAQAWLEKTLQLRPLYLEARLYQAQKDYQAQRYQQALAHYQFILNYVDEQNEMAQQMVASLSATIKP